MTAPTHQPQSYTEAQPPDSGRDLARVLRIVIGIVRAHWDAVGMAPGHPSRHAARTLECYLERRYGV
jgi:hypothetical protein